MSDYFCFRCRDNKTYVKKYTKKYSKEGIEFEVTADGRYCSKCNYPVYDKELDGKALDKVYKTYNKIKGYNPKEIINLRKKYNLSQSAFAKIIGCAKKTLISYEKGTSIPNDNFLITLKTLMNKPETIVDLIDSNKDLYTEEELELINKKVLENMPNNINQLLFQDTVEPNIFNGNKELDVNHLNNLMLYLTKDGIFKTKLLKEFFYTDYYSFSYIGLPVTGLEYAKLPFGPVPDTFDVIIYKMVSDGLIKYDIEYDEGYEKHIITAKKKADLTVFNEYELACINHVKDYFKDYSVKGIVDKSHKEKAWLETEDGEKIRYDFAYDIDLGELTEDEINEAEKICGKFEFQKE